MVISGYASAKVSLGRISEFLAAEELAEPYRIDQTLPLAVQVNGDFTWETVLGIKEEKGKAKEDSNEDKGAPRKDKKKKTDKKAPKDELQSRWWKSKKTTTQDQLPSTIDDSNITGDGNNDSSEKPQEPPFSLNDIRFEVPKGAFVAIVGPIGCGKVSEEVNLSII
jgi:ATP-binding cassette, subfamily C (CFTR/MRP), member 1